MSFGVRNVFRPPIKRIASQKIKPEAEEVLQVQPVSYNYSRLVEEERLAHPTIFDQFPFPNITYSVLDNINNFSLSYYRDTNSEVEVALDRTSYNFDNGTGIKTNPFGEDPRWLALGAPGNNDNNSIVRTFPKCFDVAAEFSIKINAGTTLTELLCFEYHPSDADVLEKFSKSIGGKGSFIHTGGNMNCIVSKYDKFNVLEPRVLNCILDPPETIDALKEPLQYCGKISLDFSRLVVPDEVEVIVPLAGSERLTQYRLKIDILLKLSVFITYMFL